MKKCKAQGARAQRERGFRSLHSLKTWPPYFDHIRSGKKTFDVRKDDRDYRVGDLIYFEEYIPDKRKFTGERHPALISYKLNGGQFGIEPGFCVLGLAPWED